MKILTSEELDYITAKTEAESKVVVLFKTPEGKRVEETYDGITEAFTTLCDTSTTTVFKTGKDFRDWVGSSNYYRILDKSIPDNYPGPVIYYNDGKTVIATGAFCVLADYIYKTLKSAGNETVVIKLADNNEHVIHTTEKSKEVFTKFNRVIVTVHPHQYPSTRYDYSTEDEFTNAWTKGHVMTFNNIAELFDYYPPEEDGGPTEDEFREKLEEEEISPSYDGGIVLKIWDENDDSLDQVEIVREADYNAFEWAEALTGDDMSSSTVTVQQDGESYADFEKRAWEGQCGLHNEMSSGRFGIDE